MYLGLKHSSLRRAMRYAERFNGPASVLVGLKRENALQALTIDGNRIVAARLLFLNGKHERFVKKIA